MSWNRREEDQSEERWIDLAVLLVRSGRRDDEIMGFLAEAGADMAAAEEHLHHAIARERRRRQESATEHLEKGGLWLAIGLVASFFISLILSAGSLFVVATGALTYGVLRLIAGLALRTVRDADPRRQHDVLRWLFAGTFAIAGIVIAILVEMFQEDIVSALDLEIFYYGGVIVGYLMAVAGIAGILDPAAMRLRSDVTPFDPPARIGTLQIMGLAAILILTHFAVARFLSSEGFQEMISPLSGSSPLP